MWTAFRRFEETLIPDREPGRLNLTLLLVAAAALGAVMVLARQATYGVGLHWDSIIYVSVARNLLDGDGFLKYNGYPYVSWPPLYPLLLAAASLDVLDPLDVAGPLNAALFGVTIFVVGQYLGRRLESRFLVVWAALAIALAAPLAGLAGYALTGTAFILLVTLTLIHAEAHLAAGKLSSLVWACVWAALAWQTRYVGAALLAAVAVMLLARRGARPAQRVRRAAGFALLAGAPMAVWLVRNRLASGTFTGARGRGSLSWTEALSGVVDALAPWTAFDLPLVEWQAVALLGILPAAALAAACGVLIRERSRRPGTSCDWLAVLVFGGFALAYFMELVASVLLGVTFHGVHPRFLAPRYVPLLIAAAFALDRVLGFAPGRRRFRRRWQRRFGGTPGARAAAAVVTAVLCFWTAGQIEPHAREIWRANTGGLDGYANAWWTRSETREWLMRNPLPGRILSNEPVAAYLHNDPSAEYGDLPRADLQRWLARLPDDTYVVWFDDVWGNRNFDYGRAALRVLSGLEPVAELADGAVFKAVGLPGAE